MARRRRRETDRLSFFTEAFLRVAGAIVLDTLAFAVWEIGTRSPAALLRDVRARMGERRSLAIGLVRFAIGAIFIAASLVLLAPSVADPPTDFVPTAIFTCIVALALEHFVGNDIRSIAKPRA